MAGADAVVGADADVAVNAGGSAPKADAATPPAAAIPDARLPDASPLQPKPPADAAEQDDAGTVPPAADAGPASHVVGASLVCPKGVISYPNPLPAVTQATLIQNGFGFLEGPLWIAERQELLFSDMDFTTAANPAGPAAQIRRLTPPGTFGVFAADSGSNGLALAHDGRVLAASHDIQSLSYFDLASGKRELSKLDYHGKHFNSPNDIAVRSDGHVYFTDPDYQIGPRSSETGMRGVYHLTPDGKVELLDGLLDQPNGIAISPDEDTLYVGSAGPDILAFTLRANGEASQHRVFASPGPSDGMGIDCAGNLYVTAASVLVFDPSGQKLGEITTAEPPSNVAFGGPERTTLYITAETGLYSIELKVPGRCY